MPHLRAEPHLAVSWWDSVPMKHASLHHSPQSNSISVKAFLPTLLLSFLLIARTTIEYLSATDRHKHLDVKGKILTMKYELQPCALCWETLLYKRKCRDRGCVPRAYPLSPLQF